MSLAKLLKLSRIYPPGHISPNQWPPLNGDYVQLESNELPRYQVPANLRAHLLDLIGDISSVESDSHFLKEVEETDGVLRYDFHQSLICIQLRSPGDPFVIHAIEFYYHFTLDNFKQKHDILPESCQVSAKFNYPHH